MLIEGNIMNYQDKTKEELLIVLEELQQKYDSQKEFLDKESSEHKRAVEALRESEDKYRRAFQFTSDAITITERDGTYIDVNDGFTNLTGFTKEDVIGKLSTEINIWAIPEDLEKLITGLKDRGYIENLESKFRRKDGSLITAIISANIIVLNNEPHILAIAHDISERKQMEELILKSKQQYDDLVSNIAVGVYVLHTKNEDTFTLDYVSPRMAEMLDLSIESLIASGDAIFKAIHPDDLEGFIKLNQEGIRLIAGPAGGPLSGRLPLAGRSSGTSDSGRVHERPQRPGPTTRRARSKNRRPQIARPTPSTCGPGGARACGAASRHCQPWMRVSPGRDHPVRPARRLRKACR